MTSYPTDIKGVSSVRAGMASNAASLNDNIKREICNTTPLIPNIANIICEYLAIKFDEELLAHTLLHFLPSWPHMQLIIRELWDTADVTNKFHKSRGYDFMSVIDSAKSKEYKQADIRKGKIPEMAILQRMMEKLLRETIISGNINTIHITLSYERRASHEETKTGSSMSCNVSVDIPFERDLNVREMMQIIHTIPGTKTELSDDVSKYLRIKQTRIEGGTLNIELEFAHDEDF